MAEGAGRLEADEAEAEAGAVVEEADVAERTGRRSGDIQLLQEEEASALESEVNLLWL